VNNRWRWLWVIFLLAGCGGPAKTGVDLKSEAIAFNDAGYQYYRQSRFDLAQGKFEKALEYNRLIDRRSGIAANLNNLGVIAQAQGNLELAQRRFQEALAVNRELNDAAGIVDVRYYHFRFRLVSPVTRPGDSGERPPAMRRGAAATPAGPPWPRG
jgi:tetratricopeptide (TPR) repeat protein